MKPIIFSGEMVKAILDGRKTMTRRVITARYQQCLSPEDEPEIFVGWCPYGKPGDRLWVRETFTGDWRGTGVPHPTHINYRADGEIPEQYRANAYWRPSIHMPRWASRITLEITGVRVERVQDISEADAMAEGIQVSHYYCEEPTAELDGVHRCDPVGKYRDLWDSINAKRGYGWDTNPWVWVIEFKRA